MILAMDAARTPSVRMSSVAAVTICSRLLPRIQAFPFLTPPKALR